MSVLGPSSSRQADRAGVHRVLVLSCACCWIVASLVGLGILVSSRLHTPYLGMIIDDLRRTGGGWQVAETLEGSPAWHAGIRPGWQLLTLGGIDAQELSFVSHQDYLATARDLRAWREAQARIRAAVPHAAPVTVRFATAAGEVVDTTIVAGNTPSWFVARHAWLLVLVGLAYAGLGVMTVLARPDSPSARKLLWWGLLVEANHFASTAVEMPRLIVVSTASLTWAPRLQDLAFFLSGAAILDFCLTFLNTKTVPRRMVTGAAYVMSAIVTVANAQRLIHLEATVVTVCLYLLGAVLLVVRFRSRATGPLQRMQIKWLLWGASVPIATLILANLMVYGFELHGYRSAFSSLHTVCALAFPVATAMAVLRHRLFDIDVVVHRSLVAAVVVPALLLGHAWAAERVGRVLAPDSLPAFLLVVVVVLITMLPGQLHLEEALERRVGFNRHGGRAVLRELASGLAREESLEGACRLVASTTREALEVETVAVHLTDVQQEAAKVVATAGTFDRQPEQVDLSLLEASFQHRPHAVFAEDDLVPETVLDRLGRPQPVLMLPVCTSTRTLGLLTLGPKRGRRGPSRDEIQALVQLAGALAMAADRALNQALLDRLKTMQAQIIHAGRMAALGTLAAGVAHELNTPLGYVSANAQLIVSRLGKVAENDPQSPAAPLLSLARDIRDGARQMSEVVRNMRSFSNLDRSGKRRVDVNESIRQSLRLMAGSIPEGVVVDLELVAVPETCAHPAQLNQVVLNLIANACKAVDGRGTVVVRTRAGDGHVVLEILDTGPGVSDEVRERAFDPFFTTWAVGSGMGLGLTISQAVIEAHDGRLTLDNRRDGQRGAVATVVLPASPPLSQEVS